jgi:hypothetical protein
MDLNAILEESIRRGFAEQFGDQPKEKRDEIPANPLAPVGQPRRPPANNQANQQAKPRAAFNIPQVGLPVPVITPDVQAGVLAKAADDVNDAIDDEMKSRVSQVREIRRMEHEKDIEQIRAQSMLERVRMARQAQELSSPMSPLLIDLTGTAKQVG